MHSQFNQVDTYLKDLLMQQLLSINLCSKFDGRDCHSLLSGISFIIPIIVIIIISKFMSHFLPSLPQAINIIVYKAIVHVTTDIQQSWLELEITLDLQRKPLYSSFLDEYKMTSQQLQSSQIGHVFILNTSPLIYIGNYSPISHSLTYLGHSTIPRDMTSK